MPEIASVVAVDLGASSGRVMLGRVGVDVLELSTVSRFANRRVQLGPTLHWDVLALYADTLDGLRAAGRLVDRVDGIGIDSWAVDYGLVDGTGALLGNPVHYRDKRTEGVAQRVLDELGADRLYAQNGLQFLVFNTMFQLAAAMGTPQLAAAERLLLIPDLLGYWLTGNQGAERTNASTTGLLDARTKAWSVQLCAELGVSADILPPLREPGDKVGDLTDEVLEAVGLTGSVPVWAVGSHDTASAVVGVPASSEHFAYISCGTWSLVGLELDAPIVTPQSRAANFTNEVGVDGTVRYLRNVMGLWLLQECVRTWELRDGPLELAALLDAAGRAPAFRAVIDPDDAAFLPPGDMPARITAACVRTGQRPPADAAATVRCILDSLALAYRRTLQDGQRLSGRRVDVVHLVGGGANNTLLCQLTADACGLPVEAGPVESAALGNVLVQARSLGRVGGDLASMRRLLRSTQTVRRYEPTGGASGWAEAAARVAAPMTG